MKANEVMPHIWTDIHGSIRDASNHLVETLGQSVTDNQIAYPPEVELTAEERQAVSHLDLDSVARSAIFKLVCNACSLPLFHLFTLLDGLADPASYNGKVWLGGDVVPPRHDGREFLHDAFYESYPTA